MDPTPEPLTNAEAAERLRVKSLTVRAGHFARSAGGYFADHAERAAVAADRARKLILLGYGPADLLAMIEHPVIDVAEVDHATFAAFIEALKPAPHTGLTARRLPRLPNR